MAPFPDPKTPKTQPPGAERPPRPGAGTDSLKKKKVWDPRSSAARHNSEQSHEKSAGTALPFFFSLGSPCERSYAR